MLARNLAAWIYPFPPAFKAKHAEGFFVGHHGNLFLSHPLDDYDAIPQLALITRWWEASMCLAILFVGCRDSKYNKLHITILRLPVRHITGVDGLPFGINGQVHCRTLSASHSQPREGEGKGKDSSMPCGDKEDWTYIIAVSACCYAMTMWHCCLNCIIKNRRRILLDLNKKDTSSPASSITQRPTRYSW